MTESYEIGEICLAFNGKRLYNVKIVGVDTKRGTDCYNVHWEGWNSRHDAWLPVAHLNKNTKDNRQYQKELEEEYEDSKAEGGATKKKKKKAVKKKAAAEPIVRKTVPSDSKETLQLRDAVDALLDGKDGVSGSSAFSSNKRVFGLQLRKLFNRFDVDGSNSIDREELAEVMRALGKRANQSKIESIFATLDVNGDGSIDFAEFSKYFGEKDTEADDTPYCSCEAPFDGRFMIACDAGFDGCVEWYHGSCVGVSESKVPDVWWCPDCKKKAPAKAEKKAKEVHGRRYDSAMIEAADAAIIEFGKINVKAAKALVAAVLDDDKYTKIEKRTMKFIRAQYSITPDADEYIRTAIAQHASTGQKPTKRGRGKRAEAKEDKKSKRKRSRSPAAAAASASPKAKKSKTEGDGKEKADEKMDVAEDGKEEKKDEAQQIALGQMLGEENVRLEANRSQRLFLQELRRVFRLFDSDGSNTIDRNELAAVMRNMGKRAVAHKVDVVFSTLDVNGDGFIDFDEFCKYFKEADTTADSAVYCVCNGPSAGRFMIACDAELDGCKQWYHGDCVKVSETKIPDVWFCPSCTSKSPSVATKTADYVKINGKRYDQSMVEIAKTAVKDHGKITLADAKKLLADILDDNKYTKIEKRTMAYIRSTYPFESAADGFVRTSISSWASKQGALKKQQRDSKRTDQKDTKTEEKKAKDDIVAWFQKHSNDGIKAAAKDVATLSLDAILAADKSDWREATGGALSASAVLSFLRAYRTSE